VTFGSSGRADTSDNRFIIEWEKAGSLQPANDATKNRKTIPQPLTPGKLLRKICQNIVGIDLSPLAVIAARPNYLLAPGPLLAHRGKEPLEIPVYLADSVMTPSYGNTENLFDQDKVRVWPACDKSSTVYPTPSRHLQPDFRSFGSPPLGKLCWN
jgi:hypothetical protein